MSNALSLLLERLRDKEDEARNAYLMALESERSFKRQLDALNQYRSFYSSELTNKGLQGPVTTSSYSHFTSFIGRLDKISQEQLDGLRKVQEETAKRLSFYQEIQAKRKAIEFLIEKRHQEKLAREVKQEQKMSDDLATNRYFKVHSGGSD